MGASTGNAAREPRWQEILRLGLAVRWTTLAAGLRVGGHGRPVITVGDVGAWADACVEARPEQPDEVYELLGIPAGAGNDRDSLDDVGRTLERLAAAEGADRAAELAKWRLIELSELVDRVERWPDDAARLDDDLACDMWSVCRELWSAWSEHLDRPAFFYPDGREISCYYGRDLAEVVGEYRAWIADERERLAAADAAIAG